MVTINNMTSLFLAQIQPNDSGQPPPPGFTSSSNEKLAAEDILTIDSVNLNQTQLNNSGLSDPPPGITSGANILTPEDTLAVNNTASLRLTQIQPNDSGQPAPPPVIALNLSSTFTQIQSDNDGRPLLPEFTSASEKAFTQTQPNDNGQPDPLLGGGGGTDLLATPLAEKQLDQQVVESRVITGEDQISSNQTSGDTKERSLTDVQSFASLLISIDTLA